jgi:pilus assembly protein Flp/PilA
MTEAKARIRRFLRDTRGATAIEYTMIAAFIAAVIAATVMAIGPNLDILLQGVIPGLS